MSRAATSQFTAHRSTLIGAPHTMPIEADSNDRTLRMLPGLSGLPQPSDSQTRSSSATELRVSGELPDDVELIRNWPHRVALALGTVDSRVLAAVVNRGLHPIVTDVEQAFETAAEVGPFVFLVLGAEVLQGSEGVDVVKRLHAMSPAAWTLLVGAREELDADVLLRAMRAGISEVLDPNDSAGVEALLGGGLIRAGANRERVLAIGAHPDDVEIGCVGALLDHRRRGDRITILTMSRGAVGGNQAHRTDEAAATADAIGAQLLLADLPDTRISDGIDTIRLVEAVVRLIDPTVVYVHSCHDNHQDHRAVHTATVTGTRGVRRIFGYQSPSATNLFTPTQFVAIDDLMNDKLAVLELFDSQAGRSYLEPEMVVASARYWARHLSASAKYAEPFEVIRSVGDLRALTSAPAAALNASTMAAATSMSSTQARAQA